MQIQIFHLGWRAWSAAAPAFVKAYQLEALYRTVYSACYTRILAASERLLSSAWVGVGLAYVHSVYRVGAADTNCGTTTTVLPLVNKTNFSQLSFFPFRRHERGLAVRRLKWGISTLT